MKRALIAASAYFLALFALGFVLGMIRVIFVVPRVGELVATIAEVPVMLIAAYFASRRAIRRWQVPPAIKIRVAMVTWFLALLFVFEALLGATLFGRSVDEQWTALGSPAGLVGLSAQIMAALLPLFVGRGASRLENLTNVVTENSAFNVNASMSGKRWKKMSAIKACADMPQKDPNP